MSPSDSQAAEKALAATDERVAGLVEQGRYREALAALPEREPSGTPPARARRLELEGVIRRELGQYAQAEAPFLQALSLGASSLGKEHPDYARTLHEFGRLHEELGQYASAERLFRSALGIREKALGKHADLAQSLHDLGGLCDLTARHAEAEEFYLQSRQMRLDLLGGDDPAYAQSLVTQAWLSWRHGRLRAGERLAHRAVDILRRTRGPDHPEYALGEQLLSRFLLHQARLDEAERLALHVRDVRGQVLGVAHHRYAGALENLALVRAVQGRSDEARRLAGEGIGITRAALGEHHAHVADGLAALAYTLQTEKRHAEAEKHYREALEIYRSALGERHPHVAGCLRDLAEVAGAQDRLAEAEEHYRSALELFEPHGQACALERIETLQGLARVVAAQNRPEEADRLGRRSVEQARQLTAHDPDDPHDRKGDGEGEGEGDDGSALLATSLDGLARIYQIQGRLADAEPLCREVIACRAKALGEGHPLHAEALRNLAALYSAQGNFVEATTLEKAAVDSLTRSLGPRHPETVAALAGLAELYWQKGDATRAEEIFIQVVETERERVGEDHIDHARAVQHLARLYLAMNNIPAAEVRYRQVIEYFERTHGDEHPEYAAALHDLAGLHQQAGDLSNAEQLYSRAREIRQQHLGESHPDLAQSLHGLASVYQSMNRHDEAGPLFEQALEILRTQHGDDNPITLRLRHSLALFEQSRGNYQPALEHLEFARERLTEQVGERSPLLVGVLSDLARLQGGVGDHVAAEPLWRQVQKINLAAFPDDILLHAQDLSNLAHNLRALAEVEEAESLQRQALALVEKERGADHPDSALNLHLLAGFVQARAGNDEAALDEAEALYNRSLLSTRSALGQGHPAVASVLSDLAALQASRGRNDQALETFRQAAEVIRRSLGEDHAEHVNILRHMASLHQARGDFAEAERLLTQRLTIIRRLFGPGSSVLVPSQQQLADLYRVQGRLDEAQALCQQALYSLQRERDEATRRTGSEEDQSVPSEDREESDDISDTQELGPAPEVPGGLGMALAENNLAAIHLSRAQFDLAEPLLRRSLQGVLRSVGEDHPTHAGAVYNLAGACAATGRMAEARTLLERLIILEGRHRTQLLALTPERFRVFACHGLHENYETFLSLVAPQLHTDPAGAWRTLDIVLRAKRFGMDVLAEPPLVGWQGKYPQEAENLRRLWLLDRQIATKRMAGPGAEGLITHSELIDSWISQRERLEQSLAEKIPELARRRTLLRVDTEAVRSLLQPGWALVEVVLHRSIDFANLFTQSPTTEERPGRYLAFVLKPGDTNPSVFDLGDATPIDEAVKLWREYLETAGGGGRPGAGAELYNTLVAPIYPAIKDCRGIVFAPDGELLHLPMDALPLPDGGTLFDRFHVRWVLCGRDLLRIGQSVTHSAPFVPGAGKPNPTTRGKGFFGWLRWLFSRERPTIAWRLHSAVRAESATVAGWLGVQPFTAQSVREGLFALRSPSLVHIAQPVNFLLDSVELLRRMEADPQFVPPWQSPLVACGLNLTGDQTMHCRDITRLDLWQTQAVVLSASATPSSLNRAWWRVSGLIGSFLYAGATHVVLSLWPVPEAVRAELLSRFYQLLKEGRTPAQSLRLARIAVRLKHPYPSAWAGWICVGGGENEITGGN